MNAKVKVIKAIPRWGPNREPLVELTLERPSRVKQRVTVPVPDEGIYRKGEVVIHNTDNNSVSRPTPPTAKSA